jgi:hypothetical protein
MMRVVRFIAVFALLGAALPAAAFLRDTTGRSPGLGVCLWWRSRHVTYRINASGVTQTGCQTAAAAEATVLPAMAKWAGAKRATDAAACTDFTFDPASPVSTTHKAVGNDGVNLIVFRKGRCQATEDPAVANCWSHPRTAAGDVIGLTTTTFDTKTGEILDADMELFASDGADGFYFTCGGPGSPACTGTPYLPGCNLTDVGAVVTHEAGHMLGLGHVCTQEFGQWYTDCPAETPVMSPSVGDVAQRELAPDDVAGVCTVYPKGAATVTCVPPDDGGGGCSSAGGMGIAGLLAVFAARRRS